jgi:enoyl-CoA hydratase/carnithine racemase
MQMACDLAVMVDDAFIRHVGLQHGSVPAAGATQWPADPRRRPPSPRDHPALRGDPGCQGRGVGLVNRAVPASALDATVDDFVAKLADRLPLMTRYAKVQLDFFRDLAWHGTFGMRTTGSRCRC